MDMDAATHGEPRTALVTGATKGIGRELVRQLTGRGLRVYATGRDEVGLAALIAETGCVGSVCDLAEANAVIHLYASAREALGQVHVLVNNAGFNHRKSLLADSELAEFEAQYAVNLRAPYLLCREALNEMAPRKSGHLINVNSTCALFANETMGVYTTMKSGLKGLTGVLIKEARRHQIKVTGVYPGGVNTSFREADRPDYLMPESVAAMIVNAIFSPADVVIHELTFRPFVETNF